MNRRVTIVSFSIMYNGGSDLIVVGADDMLIRVICCVFFKLPWSTSKKTSFLERLT
jgi:hypothetical protein